MRTIIKYLFVVLSMIALAGTVFSTAYAYYPSPYEYKGEYEYRVQSIPKCGGIIAITLFAENKRTANSRLRVEITKCDSTAYISGGYYYIVVDGKRSAVKGTVLVGAKKLISYINSSYLQNIGIKPYGRHTYKVELYSNNAPTTAKWTGSASAETWGRCWCTDYVRQFFNLTNGTMPNGGQFGPYLLKNGYRALKANESPVAGDVVVFPNNNHVAVFISKNASSLYVRQGGSAPDGWQNQAYCYNVRNQTWKASTYVVYYTRRPAQ